MNREERRAQLRRRLKAFGFRVEKVCTDIGLATLTQVHYQPNDIHHCCGRYIRSSVDRAQHNAIFHKVAMFLIALVLAASTALAGEKIVAKSADVGVTYFANDLIAGSGELPNPKVIYRVDGMNAWQKVAGGYILMEISNVSDFVLSSPVFLATDENIPRDWPVEGWVVFTGYYHYTSIKGFPMQILSFQRFSPPIRKGLLPDSAVSSLPEVRNQQPRLQRIAPKEKNVDVDGETDFDGRPGAR